MYLCILGCACFSLLLWPSSLSGHFQSFICVCLVCFCSAIFCCNSLFCFCFLADQIYGDQEMNSVVRNMCIDYMVRSSLLMHHEFVIILHTHTHKWSWGKGGILESLPISPCIRPSVCPVLSRGYLLNCCTVFNQTWYDGVLSWGKVFYRKIVSLSSRSGS